MRFKASTFSFSSDSDNGRFSGKATGVGGGVVGRGESDILIVYVVALSVSSRYRRPHLLGRSGLRLIIVAASERASLDST